LLLCHQIQHGSTTNAVNILMSLLTTRPSNTANTLSELVQNQFRVCFSSTIRRLIFNQLIAELISGLVAGKFVY